MSNWVYSPQGVLGLFPAWFAPIQTDWPANFTLTGFPLFDQSGLRQIDAELENFLADGPPPVAFTPGSTLVDGLSYYTAAANALDALGQRGIFLASDGKTLPTLTPNVIARPYVPLSKLLPRVKALVHHGGIGTVSQAFASGTPQLVTPFAFDQFDNAERVERLRCGLQIDSKQIASKMLPSLRSLLEDEDIHKNCATVQSWTNPGEIASLMALSAMEALSPRTLSKIR
ncbi:nucleotide disphospho-sugar-binding domain-containing protein [Granulicella sp. dw_53]|uniref:glycosyltransferase n=1 Tax=Granulicella sp. dw_53 TaxID=2719792 RepID=UPI00210468E6|nr:nucleotide disphospho-sugar-binding domain-containing protein [Granulicella sp. dw_53]